MEMPEAVITAVAAYLADFEKGRTPDENGNYDCRESEECQLMARFATTCRAAYDALGEETRLESEDAAERIADYDAREERIAEWIQEMGDFTTQYPEELYKIAQDSEGNLVVVPRNAIERATFSHALGRSLVSYDALYDW